LETQEKYEGNGEERERKEWTFQVVEAKDLRLSPFLSSIKEEGKDQLIHSVNICRKKDPLLFVRRVIEFKEEI